MRQALERRLNAEANTRRTNLINAMNTNKQMHADRRKMKQQEHEEWIQERDNVQTSLISKKQQDAQEQFKQNQRKSELLQSVQANQAVNLMQTQNFKSSRNNQIVDELNWLQEIKEAEAIENQFMKSQKLEQ